MIIKKMIINKIDYLLKIIIYITNILDSFKKFNIRKFSLYEPFETIYLVEMKNQHNNPIRTNTTKQNLSLLKWGRIL